MRQLDSLASARQYRDMALAGVIRVSEVAHLLGVTTKTARKYVVEAGICPIQRPIAGMLGVSGRTGAMTTVPWMVTLADAVRLLEYILPRKRWPREHKTARARLQRAERALKDSTRNLHHHGVGGTPSNGTPTETGASPLQQEIPDHDPLRTTPSETKEVT